MVLSDVSELLETARVQAARAVNAVMTATYWEIGRRIVEHEQSGKDRADYGVRLLEQLACDLTARFGRGFGRENLRSMRQQLVVLVQKRHRQFGLFEAIWPLRLLG